MDSVGAGDVWIRSGQENRLESLLRATLAGVDSGILLTDLDHVALACNGRFAEIWGVEGHDVVNAGVEDLRNMVRQRIPSYKDWVDNLAEVYADPDHRQVDEIVLHYPKVTIVRYTGPVVDSDGTTFARIWTFQDRTNEARLRRMREFIYEASKLHHPDPAEVYRSLTQRVSDHYGSLALLSIQDGDFMAFRAVGAPPGHPAHDMAGNSLAESFCQFCLAEGAPFVVQDARLNDRTAKLLPVTYGLVRYAGVPVLAPDGRPVGTFCIMDDRAEELLDAEDLGFLGVVAARLASELERERQIHELRMDLRTASAELADAQRTMIEQEKLAVSGTLAASIAHDIRNILSALSLEIGMGAIDVAAVRAHLDRFSVLSHRLLAYARPEQTALEPVDVLESIERVVSLLTGHLRIHQVRIDVSAEDVPPVGADPARLDHVFVNLFLNAMQAMRGPGRITVVAARNDPFVDVSVADTGPGIPEALRADLFRPFHRKRREGFGLGLYSCRRIVEEAGGSIDIAPESDSSGAKFLIRMPIA